MRNFLLGVVAATGCLLVVPAPAQAGRMIATGHDADDHCDQRFGPQCHFIDVAISYARAGAPDPLKPVLALDCEGTLTDALDRIGIGSAARVVKCPHDADDGFASDPLTTGQYSTIIAGSSCGVGNADSLNETPSCDQPGGSTPDSDAINARKGTIEAFFDAGGGIVALAGSDNGDGDAATGPDSFYSFLPLAVTGAHVTTPFTLTADGIALGFQDAANNSPAGATFNDINCCPTHNAFAEPAGGGLIKVAERDNAGLPETLFAERTPPAPGQPAPAPVQQQAGLAPVAGKSVLIGNAGGKVFVTLPGSKKRTPVSGLKSIPVNSTVHAAKGIARLTSAADLAGNSQTARFYQGAFIVRQKKRTKLITDIVLTGGKLGKCRSRRASRRHRGVRAFEARKRRKRRLWGNGKGRFRTKGRRSAATVRGTKWLTQDRCSGTLTKVKRGKVSVRDFGRKKTLVVRRGRRYVARY